MLCPASPCVAAIDLGGSHLTTALADRGGQILSRAVVPVDRYAGPGPIIEQIVSAVHRLRRQAGVVPAAAAIACPGIIDAHRGVVLTAANLDGWHMVPLGERLAASLGIPVRVENDGNLGALGEGWLGAARGLTDYVFVAFGTGVGGGVVTNGQLVRGARGHGGEVGYLVVEPAAPDRAGLEQQTGAPALDRRARQLGYPDARSALDAAFGGDSTAGQLADAAARAIASAVRSIAALLNPEAVIIGGGLSRQGDRLLDLVRTHLQQYAGPSVHLMLSQLGTDAQLVGAIRTALDLAGAGAQPPD